MMLLFERRLNRALRVQILEKKWVRNDHLFDVGELHNKTIGIVGLGKIGGKIAQLARAFDMKVDAVVRNKQHRRLYINRLYENSEIMEMVKECDYIINCLPATEETNGIFNYSVFSNMKPTAYYINIGRGKTTNEKDLVRALQEGLIAGAGLDVFEVEPLPEISPLWELENVIITPHYSGWTPYYMDRVIDIFCENLKAYLQHEPLPNEVNKKLGY
jgi:phosphoglycerate dehydrogenase-like enzyme